MDVLCPYSRPFRRIGDDMARLVVAADDDRTSEVGAGEAVTVNKGMPHAWCNLPEVPLRLLVVFSPGNVDGAGVDHEHKRETSEDPKRLAASR